MAWSLPLSLAHVNFRWELKDSMKPGGLPVMFSFGVSCG